MILTCDEGEIWITYDEHFFGGCSVEHWQAREIGKFIEYGIIRKYQKN